MQKSSFHYDVVGKSFMRLCKKLETPLAWKALCLAKQDCWGEVVRLKVNPQSYVCARVLCQDLQVVNFLRKYQALPGGYSKRKRREAAIKVFFDAEAQCYQTNERLSPLLFDPCHYGERLGNFVLSWRKEIKRILGYAPSPDELPCRFGPGATFSNRGDQITIAEKLSEGYTSTSLPRAFLETWDRTAWAYSAACGLRPFDGKSGLPLDLKDGLLRGDSYPPNLVIRDIEQVRGNRFTTVPKTWDIDRGICVEPSLNTYFQLGVGAYISRRLARRGLKKERSQEYHKVLARIASLTGACATIDLSSASDTVAYNLVKLVLPENWWRLVDALRSTHTRLNGAWHKLEKFSSMGNGFTFELETLLFYSLCLTVQRLSPAREDPYTPGLTISVYGDDIIVPTSISDDVCAALRFFGFSLNAKKTFTSGPFRESCGGDYHRGFDVRSHFCEEEVNEPHQLISLANGLYRLGLRLDALGLPRLHLHSWHAVIDGLPEAIRHCRGPEELGDLVLSDPDWTTKGRVKERSGIRYVRVWRPVVNRAIPTNHFRPGVVMAAALYGNTAVGGSAKVGFPVEVNGFTPRIRGSYVSGYRFGQVPFS